MPHRRGRGRGNFGGGGIRRFLEPCLLLLLHQGKNYGYELVGALKPFGLSNIAPGPVYRTLRDLEASGLAQSEWDTEVTGGPARRIYQLTEAGHDRLAVWINELRETRCRLEYFLDMYDTHITEGKGDYHE